MKYSGSPSSVYIAGYQKRNGREAITHMTINDALAATYRQEFYHHSQKNSDGSPVRCRVNGKCQVWKTRPGEFSLPVKYGLKTCFYITHQNCGEWLVQPPVTSNTAQNSNL